MTNEWTPLRVSALIALWEEGLAASEIGRRLDVTKNAVIGKVHRLGLAKRQSPIRKFEEKPPLADTISLENLTAGMCSWPTGEPGTESFHFCGHPAAPDKPYCADHCARAYVKITRDGRRYGRKTAIAS